MVTYSSDPEAQKLKSMIESGNMDAAKSQMQKMQDNLSKNKSSGGSGSGGGSKPNVSTGGLNAPSGQGFAYVDKYGFPHVVSDYDNAKLRSASGDVYDYSGKHFGGYAYDDKGYRVPLDLPGAKPYGNDLANGRGYSSVPTGGVYAPMDGNGKTLNANFSGQLGGLATIPAPLIQQESADILPAQLSLGGSNTILPASANEAGFQQSPQWVGNVYPGATWNGDSRTITTKNGDTLIEGVDFVINPDDNRAYVVDKQAAGTPASGQGQGQGYATNDPVGQIYQMIIDMQNNRQDAPVYEQPDYSGLIPKPTKGVPITANAGDTVFTPTVRYNDRVEQIKGRADANAWNQYQSQLNTYNTQRTDQRNTMSDLASLLPYSTLTYAQQLDQQAGAAKAEQDAYIEMYEQAMDMWKVLGYVPQGLDEILGVPAGTPTSDYSYKQATLELNKYKAYKSGGKSGNSGDDEYASDDDLMAEITALKQNYYRPLDYRADLVRNQSKIVSFIGMSNYNKLLADADADAENMPVYRTKKSSSTNYPMADGTENKNPLTAKLSYW